MGELPRYLTIEQAAERLAMDPAELRRLWLGNRKRAPRLLRMARGVVRIAEPDLADWIESRTTDPEEDERVRDRVRSVTTPAWIDQKLREAEAGRRGRR